MSMLTLMTEEAKAEINTAFLNNTFYIGTDGKIAFSVETDTINFLMNNLITDM